ncbi:DHA2 family efflux MFS transporter permease subunit [Streptomyces sodiiphilus]|uniref:DHA2 family efflux MFS transporter permease subunit n=1 Tax=Streptomyces sodiiphilus TaxID=226217 RepID=A0ABP5AZS6_9ACTN
MSTVNSTDTKRRERPWAVFAIVVGGYFMAQMDLTVLTVALPSITRDLDASVVEGLWAVNAYVLVLAAALITAGRLGDIYGSRRMFALGVTLFTVFSLACGLAQSPLQLILARAFQGLGAALLLPQVLVTIVSLIPEERRGTALGIRGSVGAGAAIAGPLVGGLLVSLLDWRWVFFINVPIGAALLVATLLLMPEPRPQRPRRLDMAGAVLVALALLIAVYTLTQGEEAGWNIGSWAGLAAAALLVVAFVAQQRRKQEDEPLIPFAVFHSRRYRLMLVAGVGISMSVIAFTLSLSYFLQEGLAVSALRTGAVIAPASLVSMLLAPFVGRLADRMDAKRLLTAGLGLTALGMALCIWQMTADAEWMYFIPMMFVIGAGNAMLFTPMTAIAMRGVEPAVAGAASGVLATFLQFGAVVGSAAVGVVMQRVAADAAFTDAARTAMLVPLAAVLVAAVACLAVDRTPPPERAEPAAAKTAAGGAK